LIGSSANRFGTSQAIAINGLLMLAAALVLLVAHELAPVAAEIADDWRVGGALMLCVLGETRSAPAANGF
jgi:hypothetical protein